MHWGTGHTGALCPMLRAAGRLRGSMRNEPQGSGSQDRILQTKVFQGTNRRQKKKKSLLTDKAFLNLIRKWRCKLKPRVTHLSFRHDAAHRMKLNVTGNQIPKDLVLPTTVVGLTLRKTPEWNASHGMHREMFMLI